MHDLVIRGGTVVDGTGAPGVRADVAIDGDYIVEIGRVATKGRDEIDADGHAVTPGFIDGHTHMDAQVFWDEIGTCSCWHGVTTVVMGNCGFSLAPSRAGAIDLVIENIERAEDIPRAAMKAGIDWTWETFAEYLDAVDRVPKAINYAAYVGHSALRTWAMGERAFDAAADENALESMIAELRAALQAGAIGFSTSRARNHVTVDDRPVASRLADWTEVRRLVHVMKDVGRGLFEIALDPGLYGVDAEGRRNDFAQLLAITGETRVPTTFGVPPFIPGDDFYLEMLDSAHAVGAPMFGQTHSRGISSITSL